MYVQDGIDSSTLRVVYDKTAPGNGGVGAVDPQMSPDGRLVAFVKDGEIFVASGELFYFPCYLFRTYSLFFFVLSIFFSSICYGQRYLSPKLAPEKCWSP